jgi:hypothetical protein
MTPQRSTLRCSGSVSRRKDRGARYLETVALGLSDARSRSCVLSFSATPSRRTRVGKRSNRMYKLGQKHQNARLCRVGREHPHDRSATLVPERGARSVLPDYRGPRARTKDPQHPATSEARRAGFGVRTVVYAVRPRDGLLRGRAALRLLPASEGHRPSQGDREASARRRR